MCINILRRYFFVTPFSEFDCKSICANTRQPGRMPSISYARNIKAAATPDKDGSTDSLTSHDPTHEET